MGFEVGPCHVLDLDYLVAGHVGMCKVRGSSQVGGQTSPPVRNDQAYFLNCQASDILRVKKNTGRLYQQADTKYVSKAKKCQSTANISSASWDLESMSRNDKQRPV